MTLSLWTPPPSVQRSAGRGSDAPWRAAVLDAQRGDTQNPPRCGRRTPWQPLKHQWGSMRCHFIGNTCWELSTVLPTLYCSLNRPDPKTRPQPEMKSEARCDRNVSLYISVLSPGSWELIPTQSSALINRFTPRDAIQGRPSLGFFTKQHSIVVLCVFTLPYAAWQIQGEPCFHRLQLEAAQSYKARQS